MLEQTGYKVLEVQGVPAPFPKALGDNRLSRGLLAINRALIRVSRGLFAYQIFVRVRATPTVNHLLSETISNSETLRTEAAVRPVAPDGGRMRPAAGNDHPCLNEASGLDEGRSPLLYFCAAFDGQRLW